MIVSISGTPGTGKTEIAKALSKLLGWQAIDLNKLAEEKGLYAGYDKKRKCKIVDIDAIAESLEGRDNLVIESHYAHEFDADLVVVLRCVPKTLRERLEKRGWQKSKIDENIEAEIMGVCSQEAWELGKPILEMETSKKTAIEIAEMIANNIKRFYRSAISDN